jgi:hydrogen peroxide-dependent heme synthase
MITIGLYYDVLPGKGEALESKFRAVVEAMQGVTGHKESHLYRRVDDPDSYVIISEWGSRDDFMAFLRSDAFRETTRWGRENVLRRPPRHTVYPKSEDLGGPPRG